MFSLKNKKQNKAVFVLALFLFSSGVFLLTPTVAYAAWSWNPLDWAGASFGNIFKGLLYGIFVMFGWFASAAITLFGWAINPDYISGPSGLLNRASVYEMWKFIRDFFNLFFILTLLYTAFTIVFQVAKDYKKTLLSLVLAALFVNFSFPITRVIIDATNVPMYYFVNQLGTTGDGKSSLNTVLSASQLEKILIPNEVAQSDVSQLLMAIVFLFIFSITLVVLAVMFIIRLAALVILLIFSSVGFAAAVIPGLQEYSNKWWKGLWHYALFGPAAMLMLVVATRFFAEIAKDNTVKQFVDTATKSTTPESASFVAAMAMFSIPIIMLWMALGLASSMSIAGAGAVVGKGKEIAKWAGRKTYNNPVGRGLYGGAKKVVMDGKIAGVNYGGLKLGRFGVGKLATGNYWATPSNIEATIKGGVTGWGGGAKERTKLHQQAVNKAVKESKENQVSDSTHVKNLASSDRVEREAAALSLAENKGIRNAETLANALKAVGDNQDAVQKILDGAKSEAVDDMTAEHHGTVMNAFYEKDPKTGEFKKDEKGNRVVSGKMKDAHDAYNSKLKRDGQLKIQVDYEISQKVAGGADVTTARKETYDNLIGKLSSDDLAKQGSIHSGLEDDESLRNYLKERVENDVTYYQEAYKKMSKVDREKWTAAGMFPRREQPKTDEGEKMKSRIAAVKNEHGKES